MNRRANGLIVLLGTALLIAESSSPAFPVPEISHIQPDYMGSHVDLAPYRAGFIRHTPQLVLGEDLAAPGLEIWAWDPAGTSGEELAEALRRRGDKEPVLPARPPQGARKMTVFDVEGQVAVAELQDAARRLAVLWAGRKGEFSRPYLYNTARPLWMNEDKLAPGEMLRIFGLGLKRRWRENFVALRRGTEVRLLKDYQSPFYIATDERLLEMAVPADMIPGRWEVWVHNGWGGEFGWSKAGNLEIVPPRKDETKIFDVRTFGAMGDGLHDDTEAVLKAVAAAAAAKGTVYFTPGTYRVARSIRIPSGVSLRGAGRENTIIEGFGYQPVWTDSAKRPPEVDLGAVLLLEPRTGIKSIGVKGATVRGLREGRPEVRGGAQVQAAESGETFPDGAKMGLVSLEDVHLHSFTYHPDYGTTGAPFYGSAFRAVGSWRTPVWRLKIVGSSFHGNITLGTVTRADIVGNTIRYGGAIESGGLFDCFIDANIMQDNPYRMYSYRPVWNTYYRSNEIRGFGNRRVAGASEPLMFHGGGDKEEGSPTAAGLNTLSDAGKKWQPGQFKHNVVLITSGRGFGQYRRVLDNSEDTVILDRPWRVAPDKSSRYCLGRFFVDSVFYDNLNDGLGRMTLWLDCLNIVVENQRDNAAGGIDIWGTDGSSPEKPKAYNPSWYNMLIGCHMEGSRIYQFANENAANTRDTPVLFGNFIIGSNIVRPVHRNVRENSWPTAAIDAATMMSQNRNVEPAGNRTLYTMIVNNTIVGADVGIRVPLGARKTFLLRNNFLEVKRPVLDKGLATFMDKSNRERTLEDAGARLGETPLEPPVRP